MPEKHTEKLQDVIPERQPPGQLVREARQLASELRQTVYIYQSAHGWGIARKLSKIPSGALISEVQAQHAHPEQHNTGGC